MGLNKKMKFFHRPTYPTTTPVSNYCWVNLVYLYDVPNIIESSLSYMYRTPNTITNTPKVLTPITFKWKIKC